MTHVRGLAVYPTTLVIALALALLLPHVLGEYYLHVADITLINVVLALGLNFILGYGGQISLAQSAFFGIGAYSFGILEQQGWPAAPAALAAVAIAAVLGWVLGAPTLRLRGHYLALATLAFALIVGELFVNLDWLTGGANGMLNIAGIGLAGDNTTMLYVLLALATAGFLVSVAFARSPLGLRVRAFRDDPTAALAGGINTGMLKLLLFVISALYAGLAGVGYVSLTGYISPDLFAWQTTFSYLAMVVVGGLGSSLGAVIGAVLYTLAPEWLRFLQQAYFAIFGLFVVIIMAAVPGGLVGLLQRLWRATARSPRLAASTATLAGSKAE